jgi:GNAT superfamily N-acetyltransferase
LADYACRVPTVLDPISLRHTYDAQLRTWVPDRLPPGHVVETDGPVTRISAENERGFVTYCSLDGLTGADLDALIVRQCDHFAARGQDVEWKLHGHDLPSDLPDRLRAAGFVPEEQETVVIGLAEPLATTPVLPAGVRLREVTERADLDRIAAMETAVWGEDRNRIAVMLADELAADPDGTTVVVAESLRARGASAGEPRSREAEDGTDRGLVVCAGWIRYVRGTAFATLWGGSTLPEWRRQGIYTAVVAYRARLAVERGYRYLQVDASHESRPILMRYGFVPVTTTTPYVWSASS